MRALLRSWGDSLKLLLPGNLKQWALITFKGTVETYKILFKRFWWLLALIILSGGILLYGYPQVHVSRGVAQLLAYLFIFFVALWLYACILAARPSVGLKDTNYFVSYYKQIGSFLSSGVLFTLLFLTIALLLLVGGAYLAHAFKLFRPVASCCGCGYFGALLMGVALSFTFLLLPSLFGLTGLCVIALGLRWWALTGTTVLLHVMFSPIYVFTVLFLLDARPSTANVFKSVWNGIKLAWYTYPITLLLLILFQVLGWGLMMIGSFTISFLVGVFLFPLYINIFMYLYIKQIHEQPDRYLR